MGVGVVGCSTHVTASCCLLVWNIAEETYVGLAWQGGIESLVESQGKMRVSLAGGMLWNGC